MIGIKIGCVAENGELTWLVIGWRLAVKLRMDRMSGWRLVDDWLKIGGEAKDGQKEWLFSGWRFTVLLLMVFIIG